METNGDDAGQKTYENTYIEQAIHAAQKDSGPFPRSASVDGKEKTFSTLAIVGLAYAILNSWTAMAASLAVALPSGGGSVVILGILISALGSLCTAASLAEMLHVYPTSGAQYHFAYLFATEGTALPVAWFTGWIATAGWWALFATAPSLGAQLVLAIVALWNPDFVVAPWMIFVVYVLYTIAAVVINIWGYQLLEKINQTAIIWSLMGATTIAIVVLASTGRRGGEFQSGRFVFTSFINETGWPDGVSWLLGLLQSSFGLLGYDGVAHCVEEIPNPHINAPIAMVAAVLIGAFSSFIFLVVLLFCITSVDDVISSTAGALLESIYQGTGNSLAGATALQMFPVISMLFAAQGILTAAARMTAAFAVDGGLPYSPFFARMDQRNVPRNAIYLNAALCIIFGLIYLGSSSALNAILSSSVVFLNISYAIPISILLFRGRHLLRPKSFPIPSLTLGKFGATINIIALGYVIFTTVFFLFPPGLPVTASSMNYSIAVFGIISFVALGSYFITGRKNYKGPRNLGVMLELARVEIGESREKS